MAIFRISPVCQNVKGNVVMGVAVCPLIIFRFSQHLWATIRENGMAKGSNWKRGHRDCAVLIHALEGRRVLTNRVDIISYCLYVAFSSFPFAMKRKQK